MQLKNMMIFLAVIVWIMLVPCMASAHPGRLNADGCHADYINDGYHCHPERAGKESATGQKTQTSRKKQQSSNAPTRKGAASGKKRK